LIEKIDANLGGWKLNKSDSYILKDDKLFVRNPAYNSRFA